MDNVDQDIERLVDPLTLAVIDGQLKQIVEEMDLVVVETAFSTIISEAFDRASGLFEFPSGDTIVQGEIALPIFVGTMEQTIKSAIAMGIELAPGSVYITNDPYLGGTHLPDVKVMEAFYYNGEPVLMMGITAHWSDVGAVGRVVPTSIHEEGIFIPPVAIYKDGVLQEDVFRVLTRNSRLTRDVAGDLEAQLNGLRVGSARVTDLINEFGLNTLKTAIRQLSDRSESMMRSLIVDLPDGSYHFVDFVDSDGLSAQPIQIEVEITIANDEMAFDFSGSSSASVGPVNLPLGGTVASCNAALRHIFPDLPLNSGCFRPLSYNVPEGGVLDAQYPSSVLANYEVACRVGDAVFGALSQAMPERSFAACISTSGAFSMQSRSGGKHFAEIVLQSGGFGAYVDQDGLSGGNPPMSMAACTAVEVVEHRAPLRFVRHEIRPDSAGPGRFRGGFGSITEIEVLADGVTAGFGSDRAVHPPWGLEGGGDGQGCRVTVLRSSGEPVELPLGSKATGVALGFHDRVILESCGGGGYGDPHDRPSERVAADVGAGLITKEIAEQEYGWRSSDDYPA